eukprot:TRINITY_DN2384_c0_g2_i1.p1 TRINITY_DN2384_c0_g2~~TRINITY_DN2384_c0_g2_i1.p1  ORF type:complete len:171 (-),score=31.99 TRINITY_DN2384_c0_g2_i1:44-556(-)
MCESKAQNQIFNEKEMSQLCKMFELDEAKLLLVIDTLMYIYRNCAFIRVPKKILPFFQEIALDESQMEGIMLAWKACGNNLMSMLREKSAGSTTDQKLDHFSWELSMPFAKSSVDNTILGDIMPNQRAALADLRFEANGEVADIRLSKTQLQGFYEELEKIQIKVDELTK